MTYILHKMIKKTIILANVSQKLYENVKNEPGVLSLVPPWIC